MKNIEIRSSSRRINKQINIKSKYHSKTNENKLLAASRVRFMYVNVPKIFSNVGSDYYGSFGRYLHYFLFIYLLMGRALYNSIKHNLINTI